MEDLLARQFHWSVGVWGSVLVVALILEVLAWRDYVPWQTLSWTLWQVQSRWLGATLLLAAGLFVLLLHVILPDRWPRRRDRQGPEGRR